MFESLMRKIVSVMDPKLEKFRPPKAPEKKYVPKTLEDFIGVIQRTPRAILSTKERERIAAIMSFNERKVSDLMALKSEIVFVKRKEVLGPLVLDKLYKSGFTSFPVVNDNDKVVGIIHTEALNTLEIKKTDLAERYMDKNLHYIHEKDSLKMVVEEIERTNSYYFLVNNEREELVGCFTIQMLMDYLIGKDE
ncbi:CBS domain-containing protein [Candidatus Saccharibacteria bacterium]|nr:CBS domain-containing protein [Candidatus Saccharibacteria bacterium]